MAYNAYSGSFDIDSTVTAGNDQSVTGVGFQPSLVMFWWAGGSSGGDEVASGNINWGFGAAISSSSRFYVSGWSQDAAATSAAYTEQRIDGVIETYSGYATTDGIADFKSMDADGFTLTIDNQFASDYRISFLALGGSDLTNVYIGNKQRDNDLGNCAVTGVGFQPDAVIMCMSHVLSAAGETSYFRWGFGWATGSSNQGLISGYSQNAAATSDTRRYSISSECIGVIANSGAEVRDSFVSFDADGFTLNQLESTTQYYYHYICLKGGQYLVSDLTTRTDGNDIEENVGFEPVAVMFASANTAECSASTNVDHNRLSIGAGTSTSNRACQAISDEDNLADTETAYTNQDDAVYAHVIDDAIEALMDIKSIDADGFTCVMDDTESSACWVTYLAIGPAAAGDSWYPGPVAYYDGPTYF